MVRYIGEIKGAPLETWETNEDSKLKINSDGRVRDDSLNNLRQEQDEGEEANKRE